MKKAAICALGVLLLLLCACGRIVETAAPTTAPTPQQVETTPAPTVAPIATPMAPSDIPLHSVDSSCFSQVGYDPGTETLVVVFRDSGSVYAYFGFSEGAYEAFSAAGSLGRHYNAEIKGFYDCQRLR